MSSSFVVAVPNMNSLYEAVRNADGNNKLLVLEFIGSVSYRSTCEFMKPIVDSIANKKKDKADFRTIDVDKDDFKELAKVFRVQALPTFLLIKNYSTVERIIAPDKEELTKSIDDNTT
ncbi:unnamed protein product [Urochloa humidicola]